MKNFAGLAILIGVFCLLLGGLLAYGLFPRTEIQYKDKIIEKPVIQEKVVEKIVTSTISPDYKQQVIDALLIEAAGDKSLRACSGDKYDIGEISVKKVYDGFILAEDTDGDTSISDVKVKLSYDGGDCYKTLTCGLDAEGEINC